MVDQICEAKLSLPTIQEEADDEKTESEKKEINN